MLPSSRTSNISWRRSSSASRPTSLKPWFAPPSSASRGAASSPTMASAAATAPSTRRNPPLLGFFHSVYRGAPFISTTKFLPRDPRHCYDYSVVDCRHGRALLRYFDEDENRLYLVVWDPMTGNARKVRRPQSYDSVPTDWSAAVLCAVRGCDHVACHLGPFFVVFLTLHEGEGVATATVYSSETRTWSSRSSLHLGVFEDELRLPSITTLLTGEVELLLEIPVEDYEYYPVLIAPDEDDGRLGIADLDDENLDLSLWWREVGPDQVAAWTQRTVINLKNHVHVDRPDAPSWLRGSIEGTAIVFVITDLGTYKIDLKLLPRSLSCEKLKLSKEFSESDSIHTLIPYLSFYSLPGAQIEKLVDSGASETGSDEELGESEAGSSDEDMKETDAGSSDDEGGESETGSSDEESGESEAGTSDEEMEECDAGSSDDQ
ncbi:hypothetical protein CFC21_008632 [Triticum aestivum]|uniref:DUF1618 domain-containing protein n=3 Tax=Triticum TaxID=4564 RepID=A0A9R1DHC3_WHEAT|nr:uncharacterized protein LOC123143565 isoform X2 [Triticum aestivum]KAF6991557.1 hypothetical protein CFC21_008632 [Triticum aestivum]